MDECRRSDPIELHPTLKSDDRVRTGTGVVTRHGCEQDKARKPSRLLICESDIRDVHRLAPLMRDADRCECEAAGFTGLRALRTSYRGAFLRRTAFVDGQIAGMWGMYLEGLGDTGYPYFLTTKKIECIPISVIKEGKKAVAAMLCVVPRLEGYVDASYEKACRFLTMIGFDLSEPEPYGPRGVLFRKYALSRE